MKKYSNKCVLCHAENIRYRDSCSSVFKRIIANFLLSPDTFHVPEKREWRGPIRDEKRFFVTENGKALQSTETKDARSVLENASFMYSRFSLSDCC